MLQKKPIGTVVSGTMKTILGFLVLSAGSSVIQGSLAIFGDLFNKAFGLDVYKRQSAGRVLVNGKAAKAGTNVKPGDRIDIQFGNRETAVEVVSIAETVKKDEAADLYKFL